MRSVAFSTYNTHAQWHFHPTYCVSGGSGSTLGGQRGWRTTVVLLSHLTHLSLAAAAAHFDGRRRPGAQLWGRGRRSGRRRRQRRRRTAAGAGEKETGANDRR